MIVTQPASVVLPSTLKVELSSWNSNAVWNSCNGGINVALASASHLGGRMCGGGGILSSGLDNLIAASSTFEVYVICVRCSLVFVLLAIPRAFALPLFPTVALMGFHSCNSSSPCSSMRWSVVEILLHPI